MRTVRSFAESRTRLVIAVLVVISVVAATVGFVAWRDSLEPQAANPPLATGVSTKIVYVIGDSLTGGSDEGGRGQNSWPRVLNQELGDGYSLAEATAGQAGYTNRGQSGVTFGDMAQSLVTPAGSLVVFFGSRTDAGQNFGPAAAKTFESVKVADPNAKVLVVGPPWPTRQVPAGVLNLRDTLREAAATAGASFFDPIAAGWFVGRPGLIGKDGVHPTDEGHRYLAQMFSPLIVSALT